MSDSDEEVLLLATVVEAEEEEETKQKQKMWVHEINTNRLTFGEHHHLFPDLLRDQKKFLKYFRMLQDKFYELLELIKPDIEKKDTTFRQQHLLRKDLHMSQIFGNWRYVWNNLIQLQLGDKSVRRIVYDTCDAIWNKLSPIYMAPLTKEQWQQIEQEFRARWNFPNCVGSIDGKHVVINKPYHSGSLYFNYKGFCSLVLMTVVDAQCKFIMIDVGGYGKNSDGSIFANCNFGKRFREEKLDFPDGMPLPGTEEAMPYVLVGDDTFPLHRNLMRPYTGVKLSNHEDKKIFNLRLSRAKNTSEDSYGILTKRFHVYQRRLEMKPKHVNKVVLATCSLHNFLKSDCPILLAGIIENEGPAKNHDNCVLLNLRNVGGAFAGSAYLIREKLKNYFSSPSGTVEWQV